jgi:hypothetical protein
MQIRKAYRTVFVAIFMHGIWSSGVAANPMSIAEPISLCAITSHPTKFADKLVSVDGIVLRVRDFEKIYIVNEDCLDHQLAVRFNASGNGNDNFDELYSYLYYSRKNEAIGKAIHCSCIGRVKYSGKKIVLYLERVDRIWLTD